MDKPKTALRRWLIRTGTSEKDLADRLRAAGLKTHPGSIRNVADGYRLPGHNLASALVAATGIPYGRLKPPRSFPAAHTDAA